MSGDDNGEEYETNQARIRISTAAAEGMNGNDIDVVVEGGEGETVDDIEDTAAEAFDKAVRSVSCEPDNRYEYQ